MKAITTLSMLALVSFTLPLAACVGSDPQPEASATQASVANPAVLVGTYRFVYTDSRRKAYEAELQSKTASPEELRQAIADAEKEANESEIEFAADGVFHSRIAGKEIFSAPYAAKGASGSSLLVTMNDAKGAEKTTSVRFQDADTIVIQDPKKGELTFRRANNPG